MSEAKTIPPRPTATQEMILAAAQVVAQKIDADAATIAQYYRHGMDGYDLAKELDKHAYWDTSREDMEALDEVDYLVSRALYKAELDWFFGNNIEPPLPLNSKIVCGVRQEVGTITGIYKYKPGYYQVKPEGQDDKLTGGMRWIIKFEEAVLAPD